MRNVMTDRYETPEPGEQPATPSVEPTAAPADEITAPAEFIAAVPAGAAPPAPAAPWTPDATFPPAYPSTYPAAYPPVVESPAPPKRKRRVGLIIGIVLTVVLLMCAGGGVAAYFLVQNSQPIGQATPNKATLGFLNAIYADHDAAAATGFICPAARDSAKINKVITDLTAFEQQYDTPVVIWDTPVISTEKVTGTAHISLTLKTEDERVTTKKIVLDLLNSRGWWVCDVRPES
jgi:hypothetical protein